MARKKATRAGERPAKAKLKLEQVADDKVRLTVEFHIEELAKKTTSGPYTIGCGCAVEPRLIKSRLP